MKRAKMGSRRLWVLDTLSVEGVGLVEGGGEEGTWR